MTQVTPHIYHTDLQNGQTYYYAVVSYDYIYGFHRREVVGYLECTSIISADINGNVTTDVNTAVVVRAPAAGYVKSGDGGIVHDTRN
jgi:hypothetical protein